MSSVNKRKRVSLTIQQKLCMIDKLEKGASVKQMMAEYNVGDQTVRDTLKKKDQLLKFATSSDVSSLSRKQRKTLKKSTYAELDAALLEWFLQQRATGNPINGLICAAKAKYFFDALGLEGNFNASSGWLTRFKQRHGIRELSIQGELLSGDQTSAEQFVKDFEMFVLEEGYLPEQLFNADETGLYWKCLPSKTLAHESEKAAPGHKSSKERLTVLLCANAAGTHKLRPLVIGKAKKPRSFKGTAACVDNLPVVYTNQKSSWMTNEIFKDWFFQHFVPDVKTYLEQNHLPQKALLILDNAPTHPNESILCTSDQQIKVKFLPANVTSLIQPLDQGIIANLKCIYRSNLLQKLIENGNDFKGFCKSYTILESIYDIAAAWNKVKITTLKNCWKRLMPDIELDGQFEGFIESAAADLAEMAKTVEGGQHVDADNISEWFECDGQEPGYEVLTDEGIVEKVMGEGVGVGECDSEEEDGTAEVKITHQAALNHVECLLDYMDGQADATLNDKLLLRKMRDNIKIKSQCMKRQKTMQDYFKPAK